jgi:hypothetical protein
MARKRTRRPRHPTAPPKSGTGSPRVATVLGCLPALVFFLVTSHAPAVVQVSRSTVAWLAAGGLALCGLAYAWLDTLYDRVARRHRHYEEYREAYFRMTWQRNGIYRELRRWKAVAEALGIGRRTVPTSLCAVREAKRQKARARSIVRQAEALAS